MTASMNPSRVLDARVAEKVFRWLMVSPASGDWAGMPFAPGRDSNEYANVPHYSTDIAAAWTIAEKLPGFRMRKLEHGWWCTFANNWNDELIDVTEASAPLAICLAALKAVGHAA